MPLAPEAKAANLEKSLTAWIEAQLRTAAGLQVFYANSPLQERPNEWVQVDYLWGLRRDFARQVDRTQLGARVHDILNLNLCKKRSSITNIYALALLRDAVMPVFQIGQTIPLRNYDVGGTPVIGIIIVDGATENDTDNGFVSGVMVKALSISLQHTEAYTLT